MSYSQSTNKRQYHGTSSAYVLPNDAPEHKRLDAQAVVIEELIGGTPFLAIPHITSDVSKVVDIGCGTGVATIQLADVFPSATIWGLDITPVNEEFKQAAQANIEWVVGNVLEVDLASPNNNSLSQVFADNSIDYIFSRLLFLGINDWQRYFSTALRSMKSGGIIEQQELDWGWYRLGTGECLSDQWKWFETSKSALGTCSLAVTAGSDSPNTMRQAGLEVISSEQFKFWCAETDKDPVSKNVARYFKEKFVPTFPALLRKVLTAKGVSEVEMDEIIRDAVRDVVSEEGIYMKYTVTVAKKR